MYPVTAACAREAVAGRCLGEHAACFGGAPVCDGSPYFSTFKRVWLPNQATKTSLVLLFDTMHAHTWSL